MDRRDSGSQQARQPKGWWQQYLAWSGKKAPAHQKPRVRLRLLLLLWVWAALVFVVVDLFRDVPEFDRIRPRGGLYEAMRATAHEMVREPHQDEARAPPAAAGPLLELLVLDVPSDEPVADLPMGVNYGSGRRASLRTNADGILAVPQIDPFTLATHGTRRLVRPSERYPSDAFGAVVWTYTATVIAGTITLEDPSVMEQVGATLSVTGAPIARKDGQQGMSPADEPGSMAWFERNAENRGLYAAVIEAGTWTMDVPVVGTIGILAHASGHQFACASVEVRGSDGQRPDVHLFLRRVQAAQLDVTDTEGSPIPKANVQYRVQRAGTWADINPHWGYLYRNATGQPYTSETMRTGAREAITLWASTDQAGRVRIECPMAGDTYTLLIRAEGFRKHEWTSSQPAADTPVVMVRSQPPLPRYRLVHSGRQILRGTLYLCEERDGSHSVLPAIPCSDGWFACALAERGVEYVAIIHGYDESGSTLEGRVVLGDEEAVDVRDSRR